MRLDHHLAPHIRSGSSNLTVMGDAVITLGALYIMAGFYYSERAIYLGLVSVFTCVAADVIWCLICRRPVNMLDLSAVVTGMLIPLVMPATVSYGIVVAAGLFAISVAKQPFGGVGSNIFNPAAAGIAFAIVCWSGELFSYPMPFAPALAEGAAVPMYSGTAYTLYVGGSPQMDPKNILLGLSPGPMGTTNILVLVACLVYLVLRKTVRFQQPLLMLATVAAIAWIFPRVSGDRMSSVFYELAAAPTLFYLTFMFSDPVTTPARGMAKGAYAVASGIVMMFFRYTGGYEMTAPFALLMMNSVTPVFDTVAESVNTKVRRMAFEAQNVERQHSIPDDEEE